MSRECGSRQREYSEELKWVRFYLPLINLLRQQPGKRERNQLPVIVLLHINFRHHEGIGDLIAADDGNQAKFI